MEQDTVVSCLTSPLTAVKISHADIALFQASVNRWFSDSGRVYPWRNTSDPFHVLIAELMLKKTGAWKAEQAYNTVISKYGSPGSLAKADLQDLIALFRPLGLHTRALLLRSVSEDIDIRFAGKVPSNYSDLVSIRGVGQYTANAVLCLAFNSRLPLVDGSISRLFSRHFGLTADRPAHSDKPLWAFAAELLPTSSVRDYNLGLLDIASIHCRHRKPDCCSCPLAQSCLHNFGAYPP